MAVPAPRPLTPREYLAFERQSELRHEYMAGEAMAMSGASRDHNRISRNLVMALEGQLRGEGRCEAWVSDLRVRVSEAGFYTYPDVVVACGEPRFEDAELDTLLNPTVLVEVLSPSTEARDRGEKWFRYRQIPTLQEYLLVAQDRPHVERFSRRKDGTWIFSEASGIEAALTLDVIGCRIELSEIYYQVEQVVDPEGAESSSSAGLTATDR